MNEILYKLVLLIASWGLTPLFVRKSLLRSIGANIAANCTIYPHCTFSTYGKAASLTIQSNSFVNEHCYFDTNATIHIGKNVAIAPFVKFVTTTHKIADAHKRVKGRPVVKSIVVGDGSWIGAGSMILPGVTVGKGCVIAAGSVVTKDCLPNCLYAGVPAKMVKELPE